ncbi:MAG: enoyl-CoA hydratase [Hyphomicrobiaceae bacterium]|jgi:enoyl-CoA hydratase
MVRLQRQIPYAKAMEILLIGDNMSAEEAHRVGFVNEVVEPKALMPRALELAAKIAKNAPLAVQAIKEAAIRTNGLPLDEAFAIEHECSAKVMTSSDAREGPRAFAEKESLFLLASSFHVPANRARGPDSFATDRPKQRYECKGVDLHR